MLQIALAKMEKIVSSRILAAGHKLQALGHVLNVRLSDGLLKGRVKDQNNQIVTIHVDLKHWPAKSAQCSCLNGHKCEHFVACLLELKAQQSPKQAITYAKAADVFQSEDTIKNTIFSENQLEWYSNADTAANDFFSYQLGIIVDGQQISILPIVAELLTRWDAKTLEGLSDKLLITLPFGQNNILKVELGRLKPLLRILFQYSIRQAQLGSSLKIKRYQLLSMLEAEQALDAHRAKWRGTENLRFILEQLTHHETFNTACIPHGLQTSLREYQHRGLHWLQMLRTHQFGGVLADDMGLGKTVQTLAHLLLEKEQGRLQKPCLIIAPTSVVGNWLAEATRFAPALRLFVFHGVERYQDDFLNYDLIITTYSLIQRDKKKFLDQHFYYLILDEAQFIKNAKAKTTQIIQQLQASHRLCLTGTPLENHLGELWSLFNFLMPGFLGTAKQFRQLYRTPIEKQQDQEKQIWLSRWVNPFMLRRTKNEVAPELPEKTEIVQQVELSSLQRDLYEGIRLSMEKKVREAIAKQGFERSHILVLDALLKLRQICCDPRLLPYANGQAFELDSAKLQALLELLANLMDEGRKVLVFSQFTSMLNLIEDELKHRQYSYLKLTGQSTNRQRLIDTFQAGQASIFLISLKAGGIGLNLTRADTVIHYDPWWNPAVEDQATDRTHRIGQCNPVFVYKLITRGTVEETILALQDKKRKLIEGVLSADNATTIPLTEEDIAKFFAPIS